jgi:hypothetical protein
MTEFQTKAVVDAINRMFSSHHFSICVVDECMKVTGAVRNADYRALSLYHCCHYSEMSRETKDFLFRATIENVGNVDDFPKLQLVRKSEEIANALALQDSQRPFLRRLFGLVS